MSCDDFLVHNRRSETIANHLHHPPIPMTPLLFANIESTTRREVEAVVTLHPVVEGDHDSDCVFVIMWQSYLRLSFVLWVFHLVTRRRCCLVCSRDRINLAGDQLLGGEVCKLWAFNFTAISNVSSGCALSHRVNSTRVHVRQRRTGCCNGG